jgi:transcriptional regulator with XRE-family HTH domain
MDRGRDPVAVGRRARREEIDTFVDTEETVAFVGDRIRLLRSERNLTLHALAERTGLSSSMLSLVERGKTTPSIGTLVAISSALGAHMSDLFDNRADKPQEPVIRMDDQPVFVTAEGVKRRVIRTDNDQGIELVFNDYEPGTGSGSGLVHHSGHEYGVVLDGTLTVEVNGAKHELKPGDAISYDSELPHRIQNTGRKHVRAVWVNLER